MGDDSFRRHAAAVEMLQPPDLFRFQAGGVAMNPVDGIPLFSLSFRATREILLSYFSCARADILLARPSSYLSLLWKLQEPINFFGCAALHSGQVRFSQASLTFMTRSKTWWQALHSNS
jgi:hypothetical protein